MKDFSGDNIKSFEDQILSISSQQKLKAASIWLKNNGKQIQNVKAATNSKLINVILFYGIIQVTTIIYFLFLCR